MPMAGSRWTSSMTTSTRRWCTRQTPRKWSYKQQGDIIIANNPHAAVKPLAASAWMLRTHASGNPPYAAVIRHAANGEERVLAGGKLSHDQVDVCLSSAVYRRDKLQMRLENHRQQVKRDGDEQEVVESHH
jgi:hypothetical protein